jgi:hypothetical protein
MKDKRKEKTFFLCKNVSVLGICRAYGVSCIGIGG